jgi:epoxide hydrolase 4
VIRAVVPVIALVMAVAVAAAALSASRGSAPEPGGGQSLPSLTHGYAEVNGVRLHYAQSGRGPLIIFLHGFPEFWYEWKNQLAEFGRDHTAVAPDMRGYNESSKPVELSAYQIPVLVEDVRALAATLLKSSGGPKFTLVAHDWGGVVAWVFAAVHPEMLDKLVIVNAPHPTIFARELRDNADQQRASQYMLMFRGPAAEATLSANDYALLTSMVLGAGLKDGSVTELDKALYLAAWSQPGALTGGLNYYRASAVGPPAPGKVEGAAPAASAAGSDRPAPAAPASALDGPPLIVRVPTLVIWGDKDTALLTGNLTGLDQVVPVLTVKHVPDGTHWVVREKPNEVNRLIREFLSLP